MWGAACVCEGFSMSAQTPRNFYQDQVPLPTEPAFRSFTDASLTSKIHRSSRAAGTYRAVLFEAWFQ
jgi:hypothetical protein